MINVAFINENALGHASYLLPFVNRLRAERELEIVPHVIDATPLPANLSFRANHTIRGLRKWGLDFHSARWRRTVSSYVARQLRDLRAKQSIDAVVVNTQSVALDLCDVVDALPLFVCLDATFQQLSASPWFAPNRGSKLFLPMTLAPIRDAERRVFSRAHRLLPWSEPVRDSLLHEYGIPAEKISILPPSMDLEKLRPGPQQDARPRILFLGGDFKRKGGMLVLDCYRRHFADRCDLHLITHSPIEPEPGVFVHHGIQAYSPEWFEQWRAADIFVFPSTLETFGIVLLEALAFEVPTISTEVGAAKHILADGKAGWLLGSQTAESLAGAISDVLDHPEAARLKTRAGRMRVEEHFEISANTRRLARLLHEAVAVRQKETATVTA